jgi:hypothetical protein
VTASISDDIAALLHGNGADADIAVVVAAFGGGPALARGYAAGSAVARDTVAAILLPGLSGDLLATRAALVRGRVAIDPGRTAAAIVGMPGPARHPARTAGWFRDTARLLLRSAVPNAA